MESCYIRSGLVTLRTVQIFRELHNQEQTNLRHVTDLTYLQKKGPILLQSLDVVHLTVEKEEEYKAGLQEVGQSK